MAIEIERRFLVANASWRAEAGQGQLFQQGYLLAEKEKTVRVRVVGEVGFLTIKTFINDCQRHEYEYRIPVADARALLTNCTGNIAKTRYRLPLGEFCFEIDEFHGDNAPLILAEIELKDETQSFPRPPWLGEEVTHDGRYSNAALSRYPYQNWEELPF